MCKYTYTHTTHTHIKKYTFTHIYWYTKLPTHLHTHTHTHVHTPVCAQSLQSCPALWNPTLYSLPGSSVHGVSQAPLLEWVVISSSRFMNPHIFKTQDRGFPGGAVVRNPPGNAADTDSIPGWGTKIPHVVEQLSLSWEDWVCVPWLENLCVTTKDPMCHN